MLEPLSNMLLEIEFLSHLSPFLVLSRLEEKCSAGHWSKWGTYFLICAFGWAMAHSLEQFLGQASTDS